MVFGMGMGSSYSIVRVREMLRAVSKLRSFIHYVQVLILAKKIDDGKGLLLPKGGEWKS